MNPRRRKLVVALLAALLPLAGLAQGRPAPIKVDVDMPAGRNCRAGYPVFLRVTVNSQLPHFHGRLSVHYSPDNQSLLLDREISFGIGDFAYELYPTLPDSAPASLFVKLHNGDGDLIYESQFLLSPVIPGRDAALLLISTERQSKVEQILQKAFARQHPFDPGAQGEDPPPLFIPFADDFSLLPSSWTALGMFQSIIWDGGPLNLNAAQRDALSNWLRLGGRLVIVPDTATLEIVSPLAPAASQNLDFPAALPPRTITTSRGTIVIMPPLQPDDATFAKTLRTILHDARPKTTIEETDYASLTSSEASLRPVLRQAMARAVGYAEHDFAPFFTFCLVYLLTIAFLEPLLLRLVGVPWFTWLSFPLITLVFCIGAVHLFRGPTIAPVGHVALSFNDRFLDGSGRELRFDCIRAPAGQAPAINIAPDALAFPTKVGATYRGSQPRSLVTIQPLNAPSSTAITGVGTYLFLDQVRPLPQVPARIDTEQLVVRGDFLHGRVDAASDLQIALAFILWNGYFYELDGNLRIVRRSMDARDRRLSNRLLENLAKSIDYDDPFALARVTERAARIAIQRALLPRQILQSADRFEHDTNPATPIPLRLAPAIPAGYGVVCVITRPLPESASGALHTTCYRQLFQPAKPQ